VKTRVFILHSFWTTDGTWKTNQQELNELLSEASGWKIKSVEPMMGVSYGYAHYTGQKEIYGKYGSHCEFSTLVILENLNKDS